MISKTKLMLTALCICFIMLCVNTTLTAQIATKSTIITEYNGKQYYLHSVEKKQTLDDISLIYDVSLYEILLENEGIKRKPKAGSIIRIPYHEITENIIDNQNDMIVADTIDSNILYQSDFDSERLYKVALMMPLYLENINDNFVDEEASNKLLLTKSFSYLHFYEGFMIAIDSMINKNNLKIELKVYDVDQDTTKINIALEDAWLHNADMIVGPFHLKPFEKCLKFASEYNMLIINPMTNREDLLLNNVNMVKVKPSFSYQMQWLEQLIKDKYTDNNVFIFGMSDKEMNYTYQIEQIVKDNINKYSSVPNAHISRVIKKHHDAWKNEEIEFNEYEYQSDNVILDVNILNHFPDDSTNLRNQVVSFNYSIDSLNKVKNLASTVRNNLFIVYGDSRVFASEIVNKVNILTERYPVSLIALPDWSKFDRLFNENLMKMNTVFFDDDFTDYNSYPIGKFVCKFREKYGTEPNDMAFHGFNVGWYFINALMNFGDNTKEAITTYDIPLLNTRYVFERKRIEDGAENIYWNLYQYDRKKYEKVLLPYE